MKFTTLESFPKGKVCCLCQSAEVDLYKFGQIYKMSNIIVHYFCLLLASKIKQNGADNQGIWGFFLKDIREEVSRGKLLRCSYCTNNGATIHCSKKSCRKVFHYSCGIIRGTKHLFFGEFKSYCDNHNEQQVIPIEIIDNIRNTRISCIICLGPISVLKNADVVWPICCKPTTVFHRLCIQKMAFNSGYYFKCPLCNNKSKFRQNMKQLGIYIPKQEAAWEQEPNAYQELLINALKCEAESCICPRGREFDKLRTKWHMLVCSFCGVNNIHVACAKLIPEYKSCNNWKCSICIKLPANTVALQDTANAPRESVGSFNPGEDSINTEENLNHAENTSGVVQETNSQSEAETLLKNSNTETTPVSSNGLLERKHSDIKNTSSLSKQLDDTSIKDNLVLDNLGDKMLETLEISASTSDTVETDNSKFTESLFSSIKEEQDNIKKPKKPKLLDIVTIDSEDEGKNETNHKIEVGPVTSLQQLPKPRLLINEIVNIDSEDEEEVEKTAPEIIQKPRLLVSDVVIVESDEELENVGTSATRKRRQSHISSPQPLKKQACSHSTVSQQAENGEPITFFMMSKERVGECLGMSIVKRWNANNIYSLFSNDINSDTVTLFLISLCKLSEKHYEYYFQRRNQKAFSLENFLKQHSLGELLVFSEKRKLIYRIFIAQKQMYHNGNSNNYLFIPFENTDNNSLVKCNYYKNPVNLKQMIVLKAIKFHTNDNSSSPVQFKYLLKSSDSVNFCKFILSITVGNLCYSICDSEGSVFGEMFNNYLPSWVQGTVICYTDLKLNSVLQETIVSLEENRDVPFTILLALANFSSVSRQSQNCFFFDEIELLFKKYPKVNIIVTTVLFPKEVLSFLRRQIKMFNQHLIHMANRLGLYYWDIRNISIYSLNSKKYETQ